MLEQLDILAYLDTMDTLTHSFSPSQRILFPKVNLSSFYSDHEKLFKSINNYMYRTEISLMCFLIASNAFG